MTHEVHHFNKINMSDNNAQKIIEQKNMENVVMNNNQKFPNISSNLQYISAEYSLDMLKPILNNYLKTQLLAKNEAYDWIEYSFALLEVFRLNQQAINYGNISFDIIQNMLDDKNILNYSEQEKLPILLSAAVAVSIHKSFLPRKEHNHYKEIHLTAFTAFKVARKLAPKQIPSRDVMFLHSEIIIGFIDNYFEKNITEASRFYAFLQKASDRFELYGYIITKVILLPHYGDETVYASMLYASLLNIIARFLSLHIDDVVADKEIVFFCKHLQEAILEKAQMLHAHYDVELPEVILGQGGTAIYHESSAQETHIKTHSHSELIPNFSAKEDERRSAFLGIFG